MGYQRNHKPFPGSIPELDSINRSVVWRAYASDYTGNVNHCLLAIFVQRGWQDFRVDGQWRRVSGGQLFVIPPGKELRLDGRPTTRIVAYDLYLDLDHERPFLGNPVFEPLRSALRALPMVQCEVAPRLIQQAADFFETVSTAEGELPVARSLAQLTSLCFALLAAVEQHEPVVVPEYVEQAILYMQERLQESITLAQLADHVSYSRSALIQGFRRYTGVPPMEYLLQLRIQRATHLLTTTDQNITQIAYQLGFASSQHFATVFNRYTLLSPTAYRSQR